MQNEEDEVGLSKTGLNKLIKDTIPQARVSTESRDLLHACCMEFIKVVGGEANKICAQEAKKTIGNEHIFKALEKLGFSRDYIDAGQSVMGECNKQRERKLKRQHSKLEKCGIPEEELLRQQQLLIEKARAQQAEAEQNQLAQFQQMLMQQQQQSENGSNLNTLTTDNSADIDEDYDAD